MMKIYQNFTLAFKGLRVNKSRSLLTILGIVIGVMSIIIVMSIGKGANQYILNELESFGATTIVVAPGKAAAGPAAFESLLLESLKERELNALKDSTNVPGVRDITPEVLVPGSVVYGGETYNATIIGTYYTFPEFIDAYPNQGSFFSEQDVKDKASVAVIGYKVKQEFFGDSTAIGQKIKIKGRNFKIVGVFPKLGQLLFFNMDEIVAIPYSTAQTYILGQTHFNELIVRIENEEMLDRAVYDIEATLRELHDITDPDDDDFHVRTQEDIASTVNSITSILTIVLAAVAAISLLVGGIGIMNIMLVSVTERTREIGLRKAVGATKTDIVRQFLFEAVVLTVVGGIIGILLGAGFSYLASIGISKIGGISGWKYAFPIDAAILGVAVSAIVGLIFGIYPAKQAAEKDPIEALRYE